jgi:hypothetical protein
MSIESRVAARYLEARGVSWKKFMWDYVVPTDEAIGDALQTTRDGQTLLKQLIQKSRDYPSTEEVFREFLRDWDDVNDLAQKLMNKWMKLHLELADYDAS